MQPSSALRDPVLERIAEIGSADLLVGIPTYNSEATIEGVMRAVYEGLERHGPERRAVLFVSDGGSLDDTRERAHRTKSAIVPGIVAIYRGLPGKGTSLRAVFEAGVRLGVRTCAVFDADLRSITGEWVRALLDPVLLEGFDFVSPYYVRHKYDATITNHLAYSLTRALYGKRVRQPIGGDFGFSRRAIEFFTREEVWDTDVAKFGIDIWMTTLALNEGFRLCEAWLGAKVHDPKDPGASLGPMFRQVVGTLFGMMARYERVWRGVRGSEPVPLLGKPAAVEPPPVEVSFERLLLNFRTGLAHFGSLWREVLGPEQFEGIRRVAGSEPSAMRMDPSLWARTVYDLAATYQRWARDRYKLVEIMTPLYYGRVAAFVQETRDMTTEEADRLVVEPQAERFEEEKSYLLSRYGAWEAVPLSEES